MTARYLVSGYDRFYCLACEQEVRVFLLATPEVRSSMRFDFVHPRCGSRFDKHGRTLDTKPREFDRGFPAEVPA